MSLFNNHLNDNSLLLLPNVRTMLSIVEMLQIVVILMFHIRLAEFLSIEEISCVEMSQSDSAKVLFLAMYTI